MSALKLRMLSAAFLAPLIVLVAIWDDKAVWVVSALALGVSVHEWAGLSYQGHQIAWRRLIGGIAYLFACVAGLVYVRAQQDGASLLLYMLLAVWLSDSCAYLFGKTLKGPKMAPSISPNKTWAGLVGACVGATLGGFIVAKGAQYLPDFRVSADFAAPLYMHVLAGTLIGIIGQLGDLLVSVFKRRAGVKDTGTLIPGHGGILDRIDALLLVSLVAALVLYFVRGA